MHRSIRYRPDIDGLRAIAILSVVAYHCAPDLLPGGFTGVDVFFVISGYLIGSLVYSEIRNRTFTLANFYARRARRILPALFVVLLFTYGADLLLLTPRELWIDSPSAIASIFSFSNIYFYKHTGDYFNTQTGFRPLLMTWTLGIEEQFYLLFPLLMLLMRKMRWQIQLAAIGGLALASFLTWVWASTNHPWFAFFMLPARAWELGTGVSLAIFEANRPLLIRTERKTLANVASILGLALIFFSVSVGHGSVTRPNLGTLSLSTLWSVVGAALLIGIPDGIVNRLISWRPIVFVGLVSYSWYLWHWPLLSYAHIAAATGGALPRRPAAIIALLSFVCAVLSYWLIEQPLRRSKTPASKLLLCYAALALAVMLPPVLFHLANGLPQRSRSAAQMDTTLEEFANDQCLVGDAVDPPLYSPCVPPGQSRAIALVGDSHASDLAGALRSLASKGGYRLIVLAKGSCPPLGDAVSRTEFDEPDEAEACVRFNHETLTYVASNPQITVVVFGGFWSPPLAFGTDRDTVYARKVQNPGQVTPEQSSALLEQGLQAAVGTLTQAGKTVYLVQDQPNLKFDPQGLMKTRSLRLRFLLSKLIEAGEASRTDGDFGESPISPPEAEARAVVTLVAEKYANVHLVDLRSNLCNQASCRFALNNQTLYVDDNHLSTLGAEFALKGFQLP